MGNTPLHYAVKWNSLEAAKSVISLGFDVNAQNLAGKTSLSDAARSGKMEMAQRSRDVSAIKASTFYRRLFVLFSSTYSVYAAAIQNTHELFAFN